MSEQSVPSLAKSTEPLLLCQPGFLPLHPHFVAKSHSKSAGEKYQHFLSFSGDLGVGSAGAKHILGFIPGITHQISSYCN